MRNLNKSVLFIIGLLLGALVILAIRYFDYKPADAVHYHANFALYINGQQEKFKNPIYYTEETGACSSAVAEDSPKERAHMHDNMYDVVHVEDEAVTWGQFFENLGWVIDNKLIESPTQIYTADDQHKIHFILNGQQKDYITNLVIGDKDRLLIDYGDTSAADLQKEYKAVPATAAKFDTEQDPKSCSGSKAVTPSDRMHHMI